ncbi:MAG: hypothetical protein JW717_07280 [Marinilabiliaceae bacterium]|nr:hypothetical protein [Marinilabiliaceae bacterium]
MKRLLIIAGCFGLLFPTLHSQDERDVLLTTQSTITGTARSMALGNAMGALGGDMTAIYINPAGLAVYQTNEFSFSLGLDFNKTTANYEGTKIDDNLTRLPLQSIGIVGTYKPIRQVEKGIVSTHFSFNYNRINNFNQNSFLAGENISSSMLDQFRKNANGLTVDELNTPGYEEYYTSSLAYEVYLLNQPANEATQYYNAYEDYEVNVDGINYFDRRYIIDEDKTYGVNQTQLIDSRGYAGEYSLAGGINISNKIYLGASVNFQSISYDNSTSYREAYIKLDPTIVNPLYYSKIDGLPYDIDFFDFETHRILNGNSINAKLGIIYKPFHELRLGFAYHTPNFFNMRQSYNTYIEAVYMDREAIYMSSGNTEYDYNYITPQKFIFSAGYIFGNIGLLSLDYEYQDVGSAEFVSSDRSIEYDSQFLDLNNYISDNYKPTNTVRAGIEIKAIPSLMLRLGGGYYSSPQKKNENYRPEVRFDDKFTASGGIGFRNKLFFMDITYMRIIQKYDYLPYNYINDEGIYNNPVQMSSLDNRFSVTCGWKF